MRPIDTAAPHDASYSPPRRFPGGHWAVIVRDERDVATGLVIVLAATEHLAQRAWASTDPMYRVGQVPLGTRVGSHVSWTTLEAVG